MLHRSYRALFSRPAGYGPVHTDENHAFIIPQAKAEDNTYSCLALEVEQLEEKNFQRFSNEA